MKKELRHIVAALVFLFSTLFFQQCRDCPSKPVQTFKIHAYTFNQVYKLKPGGNYDYLIIDSVSMGAMDTIFFSFIPKTKMAHQKASNGDLFACDPVFPRTQSLGDSMKVFCLNDFDSQHPAGSEVSECFLISNDQYSASGQFSRVFFPCQEFKTFSNGTDILNLALIKKPSFQNVKFKIFIYQVNLQGAYYLETPEFRFF